MRNITCSAPTQPSALVIPDPSVCSPLFIAFSHLAPKHQTVCTHLPQRPALPPVPRPPVRRLAAPVAVPHRQAPPHFRSHRSSSHDPSKLTHSGLLHTRGSTVTGSGASSASCLCAPPPPPPPALLLPFPHFLLRPPRPSCIPVLLALPLPLLLLMACCCCSACANVCLCMGTSVRPGKTVSQRVAPAPGDARRSRPACACVAAGFCCSSCCCYDILSSASSPCPPANPR